MKRLVSIKRGYGFILVSLSLGILVVGCSPKAVKEDTVLRAGDTRARQIEPEARGLYFQAERAFNQKNYDLAQKLYTQVRVKFPKGKAFGYASYRLGIIHYYREDYVNASREFETFLQRVPQSELTFDAIYNWAASEYQLARYERANQILARLKKSDIQAQGPRRAETVYALSAKIAEATGNLPGVVSANAAQMQLPIEERVRTSLEAHVDETLEKITNRPQLQTLFNDVTEPITKGKIASRLNALASEEAASQQVPGADVDHEAGTAATVVAPPTSLEGAELTAPAGPGTSAQAPQQLPSGAGTSGQRTNIGVALPLTGRWAAYGKRALDGILLASRAYNASSSFEIKVFVEDTQSNPLIAQNAVDTLFYKKNVMAVIGPLNWKESVAVGERAQQLGIMNLSLSAKEGISEKGPYLFQNALTPRVQLESLVRFCVTQKKMKRFAILAPSDSFGKDMTQQFWDLVEHYGGKVVEYQTYPPGEKDFQAYIREMVGLSDARYRRLEAAKLADYLKEQKTKTGKEPKTQLPSIIDFDALFIPDSPKAVAQIAPSLAYFDVNNVALLGTTEWNSEQFYKRGGKYVEGAIFPAGLSLNSKNATTREFIRRYQEAYSSPPDLLAAQAFEAMELIIAGLRATGSDQRNALVNRLSGLKDFETPLGVISFDPIRIARRNLPILTLDSGGTVSEN